MTRWSERFIKDDLSQMDYSYTQLLSPSLEKSASTFHQHLLEVLRADLPRLLCLLLAPSNHNKRKRHPRCLFLAVALRL